MNNKIEHTQTQVLARRMTCSIWLPWRI